MVKSVSRAQTKRDEAAAALEKARNASYADDAEKQAAVQNAAAALEAAEDALYSAQKAAEDANNAALSAAQSAEDNRNTALHTLEKEQETTEKQNALDRAAAAVTASDAETLQAELDALLAVQQAGGTLTAPSDGTLVSLDRGWAALPCRGRPAGCRCRFYRRNSFGRISSQPCFSWHCTAPEPEPRKL